MKLIDLAGQRFGRLVILERDGTSSPVRWWCLCDCGKKKSIDGGNLRDGRSTSCGCMHGNREWHETFVGKRFGRLVVLELVSRVPMIWKTQCDCGVICESASLSLLSGNKQSCGCLWLERFREAVRLRPFEALYNLVRAKEKWVDLTYEEFLKLTEITDCHYCGARVNWVPFNNGTLGCATNLDCKENSVGYTKHNVVVCCKRCNFGKGTLFSYEEWTEIGKCIRNFNRKALGAVA